MSDNKFVSNLAENGVPQLLLGPAGAAISRLIGAAIEIPAASLDSIAQKTKDKTLARSHVSNAIAAKIAETAVDDPDLIDRAMDSFLAKEIRKQRNREGVAAHALESLKEEPPSEDAKEVSGQFMSNFERFSEGAEDEELRKLFGRLLAKEIREEDSVSPSTLQFVSMLDSSTADLVQKVIPFCWQDVAILDAIEPRLNVAKITTLEQCGFWSAGKTLPLDGEKQGRAILKVPRRNDGFVAKVPENWKANFEIAILSRAGKDMVRACDIGFDYDAMAKLFYKRKANEFFSGPATYHGDQVKISNVKLHSQS